MFGDLSSVLLGRLGVGEQTPSYDGSRQTKDPSKPGYDPGAAGNIDYKSPYGQEWGGGGGGGGGFGSIPDVFNGPDDIPKDQGGPSVLESGQTQQAPNQPDYSMNKPFIEPNFGINKPLQPGDQMRGDLGGSFPGAGNGGGIFMQILRQILSGQGGQGGVSRHAPPGGFDPNRGILGGGINPNAGGGGQGSIPPIYMSGGSFSPEEKIPGQTGYYTDSRDSGVPSGTWMPYGSEGAGGFTGQRRTDSTGHPIDSGPGLQIGQNPFEKFFPQGSTNGQFDPNNPIDVGFQNGDFMTAGGTSPWSRRANPNGPQ